MWNLKKQNLAHREQIGGCHRQGWEVGSGCRELKGTNFQLQNKLQECNMQYGDQLITP